MKISKELAKGSTSLLILSILSKQEMYGYQIIRTAEVMSEAVFQMNEGTLYPILHGMEQEKLLTSHWCTDEETKRRRKYYKITPKGRKELASQKEEWKTYSGAVNRVIGMSKA